MLHPWHLWNGLATLVSPARAKPPAGVAVQFDVAKCVMLLSADVEIFALVRQALPDWTVLRAETLKKLAEVMDSHEIGVVICHRDTPCLEWRGVISALSSAPQHTCVIVLARTAGWHDWDEVIRAGGYEILRVPCAPERLQHAVKSAWSYWRSQRRLRMRPEVPALRRGSRR
jgi:DNA-binding NtrC family response regulator